MSNLKDKLAFPRPAAMIETSVGRTHDEAEPGMTYREYVAAQVLAGLVASGKVDSIRTAIKAIAFTDALIEQLGK